MTKQQALAPIHKIVRAQTQEALDAGATHAQYRNKSLNKRLMKNKEKVAREQQRRENRYNAQAKARQRILDSMRSRVRDEVPQDIGPRGQTTLVDTENRPLRDYPLMTEAELNKGLDQLQASSSTHVLVVDSVPPEHGGLSGIRPATAGEVIIAENVAENFKSSIEEADIAAKLDLLKSDTASSYDEPSMAFPSFAAESASIPAEEHSIVAAVETKLIDNPSVGEDGIVISSLPLSEPKAADLGEPGKYPLNLYGDKENYKPFPAIGDYVREDGLLSALRDNELPMTSVVDPVNDELLYAEPGSVVTEETAKLLPVYIGGKFAPAVLEGYAKGLAAVRARATDGGGDEMVPANIHEVIRRGGIADAPAAIDGVLMPKEVLGDAAPLPLVKHTTDHGRGSFGGVLKIIEEDGNTPVAGNLMETEPVVTGKVQYIKDQAQQLYPELTNVMSLNPFEGCVTASRKQMFSSMLNKHGDGVRPEGAVVETGIEAAGSDEAPDTRFALPEPTAEPTLEEELKRSGYVSGGGLSDGYIERD